MPELPEVETICRSLQKRLSGKILKRIECQRADLRWPLPDRFSDVEHSRVMRVWRRAKYLLLDFSSGYSLMLHLGMAGRLFFVAPGLHRNQHDHVIFHFSGNQELRLRDPRRFGSVHLSKTSDIQQHKLLKKLGVEPLSQEFTGTHLHTIFCQSSAPLKTLLMNAQKLVGVGNIYACEALFQAGIHPLRIGKKLSRSQSDKLCKAVQSVLLDSIASGGTTFRDYINAESQPGLHQVNLQVYGRKDQKCRRCRSFVRMTTVSGRSTYFCATCQK